MQHIKPTFLSHTLLLRYPSSFSPAPYPYFFPPLARVPMPLVVAYMIHVSSRIILLSIAAVRTTDMCLISSHHRHSVLPMYHLCRGSQKHSILPWINMGALFDTRYYRVTKLFCSAVGLWPYQAQLRKKIIQAINLIILFSYFPPQVRE